ncbi:MAG: Xaa-Pro peptidase family protein [Candidatus Omnitrophota bacterium]
MNPRIKNVFRKLREQKLDGLLLSLASNISYLTEYASRDSYLLISPKENVYFTDSRYTEEARLGLKGVATIREVNGSVFKFIAENCLSLGLKRVGFEERHLACAEFKKIKEFLKGQAQIIGLHSLIETLRQLKEPQEVEKMRKAIRITAQALSFIEDFIRPGIKEVEVVGEIERFIRYHGASDKAFDIIVASGPNSSFPHHIPSQRKLKKNEPVLIDMGVDYQGYKCDLTRIFFLDRIKGLNLKIYDIVREAQDRAIRKIGPGCKISEIDKASRQYIAEKGYAERFGHNLGHGIGLDVHEAPQISSGEDVALETGMVFTVEPGIYLPNKFGIRIEDMILVTQEGSEVLSGSIHK